MSDFLFGKMIICSGVWILRPFKTQRNEFLFDKNFCFFQNHAQTLKFEDIFMNSKYIERIYTNELNIGRFCCESEPSSLVAKN